MSITNIVLPAYVPNLVQLFFAQAQKFNAAPLLWAKQQGSWQPLSWAETADKIARFADALKTIGIKAGDRVVLVSENRPEWFIADFAIMAAGAVTVPAYTTNTERDHLHILQNSGAVAVIVSTPKLAKALLPSVYQSGVCKTVIGIEPLKIGQTGLVDMHDMSTLIERSMAGMHECDAKPDDLACIIYTSGTGGAPRGVKLHHGAMMHNIISAEIIIREDFPAIPDVFLSFLPLSHAYEHTMSQMWAVYLGAQIYYAESLDKLATSLDEVRPTIMVVVPRLFEVLRQKITKAIEKQGRVAGVLFNLALRLGRKVYEGDALVWWEKLIDPLLTRTIRKKVQERFGGRIKALVAGGAPLNAEIGIFFQALGITLLQGYGQTEAGPLISCNRPSCKIKMHTVGPPVPNTEVRIAEDGEICVRGANVMHGYWNAPEETARVLVDGWLLTGDVGIIDADGHIVITDRKKDIIVNDKGDNVSPQRVEGMVTLEPEIVQAMVYGDKRPYMVALVVPDPDWLISWAHANNKRADLVTLSQEPAFISALQVAVDRVNTRLNVIEKIRRIAVAHEAFTTDNEQMTPTLKIRRHVIKQNYAGLLDALYTG